MSLSFTKKSLAKSPRARRWFVTLHVCSEVPDASTVEGEMEYLVYYHQMRDMWYRGCANGEYGYEFRYENGMGGVVPREIANDDGNPCTRDKKCFVGQFEKSENGVHLQAIMLWEKPKRFRNVVEWFSVEGMRAPHIEVVKSLSKAYKYVRKSESRLYGPFYFGDMEELKRGKGSRNDLRTAKHILDAGQTTLDVAQRCFSTYIRYHKGLEKYEAALKDGQRGVPHVVWIWSMESGVGKSVMCSNVPYKGEDVRDASVCWTMSFCRSKNKLWFDGYYGQKVVVVDDLQFGFPPLMLQKMIDTVALRLESKGGMVYFTPEQIRITSNISPEAYLQDAESKGFSVGPLRRRFREWVEEYHIRGEFDYEKTVVEKDSSELAKWAFLNGVPSLAPLKKQLLFLDPPFPTDVVVDWATDGELIDMLTDI